MKKYIFIISLATLLSGCDKFNDIVGRIKEKSPWVYSEETDKLNNSNVFIVKKEFRNKEETAQADVEFQCDSKKVLSLRMKTYTTKQVNGEYPGAAMMFSATADYNESDGIHYIKTRNGDFKIAFPVYMEQGISNSAHIFMTGLKLSGLESIPAVVKMTYATADLKAAGYQLAVERAAIPKLFKGKDWIVEIPTENGSIVTEIDLSNQYIQKVFEACSWKPEFSNTVAQAAAPQASAATQTQAPSKGIVISGYESADESSEIKDFGKLVEYDYCYDGGGGPDHLIIKGDYQNLTLSVNIEQSGKSELIEDKSPIVFSIKGEGKVKINEKINGPMTGKIIIRQSKDILFDKNFTSHGCQ